MNKRSTILVFVDWFVPGTQAGGPIRSVYSLAKFLQHDFDFRVFTRNTDHNSTQPYAGIQADTWLEFDKGIQVYYCSEQNLNANTINSILDTVPHDKIYINSFYSKWFSIIPLQLLRKKAGMHQVVLAPRGMLGKGALQVKPIKKKIFITYAKLTGLHKGITWQASSEAEQRDIEKVFGKKARIKIAGNLSYIDQLPWKKREKTVGELKLFFLSRVVPIKNLHTALEALGDISNLRITYDIFGPAEDKLYYQKCLDIIKNLPSNIQVQFKGLLSNADIQQTLQNYHALLMPTLNENFGHAILESFCAGCPVIISDQTPWNGLREINVGYNTTVFGPGIQTEIQKCIQQLAGVDSETLNTMSHKAWAFGRQYQENTGQLKATRMLFLS